MTSELAAQHGSYNCLIQSHSSYRLLDMLVFLLLRQIIVSAGSWLLGTYHLSIALQVGQ
ncbi:hypothetical protein BDV36DRAFT_257862 [Aspergillus pseudocaelatus]|uniref:Ig-like domain-containing protein n=1 Tax=Aspergillus pseudocaelatus TaxID=1825620 RepID=A0ABQ6WLN5_9EURO|nr:hypothetical protein BDV36DRAFT_257862 [Aspergillus pseudocaelatus]